MRDKIRSIFVTFLFIAIASCSDNNTDNNSKPIITSIEPANASPGDIITIYGEHLGYKPVTAKVIISDIEIPVDRTIKWNNSFIRLNLPLNVSSGDMFIIVNNDTSNKMNFVIADKPSIEMIGIAAGEFMMGSETGFGYEKPAHKVKITEAFSISKFEITQKIFQLVMNQNPSGVHADNLPVMNITFDEAILFCNRLSAIFGLDTVYQINGKNIIINSNANGYRLPTEAEWEYACRAGSASDYPGSGILDDIGWYDGNSAYNPHPVGSKQPNAWGIFDMNGNVWEWCWDWYDGNYYANSPSTNPAGPSTGARHVIRGGSCVDGATFARSANRTFLSNDFTNCGLRIVKKN